MHTKKTHTRVLGRRKHNRTRVKADAYPVLSWETFFFYLFIPVGSARSQFLNILIKFYQFRARFLLKCQYLEEKVLFVQLFFPAPPYGLTFTTFVSFISKREDELMCGFCHASPFPGRNKKKVLRYSLGRP